MDLKGKKIGIAMTGSFCTFEKTFLALQKLAEAGADLHPILSHASQQITSRFGTPAENQSAVLKPQNPSVPPDI